MDGCACAGADSCRTAAGGCNALSKTSDILQRRIFVLADFPQRERKAVILKALYGARGVGAKWTHPS